MGLNIGVACAPITALGIWNVFPREAWWSPSPIIFLSISKDGLLDRGLTVFVILIVCLPVLLLFADWRFNVMMMFLIVGFFFPLFAFCVSSAVVFC